MEKDPGRESRRSLRRGSGPTGQRANSEAALISRLHQHIGQLGLGLGFLAKRSRP